jgi:recombination protein RecT
MPRSSQLLYPPREPAPVRLAATVLLLRDTPQGVEVLMTRRSTTASFAPGAYVFPGGGIDAADALRMHSPRGGPHKASCT